MKILTTLLLLVTCVSCSTYSDEQLSEFDGKIKKYLSDQKKTCERSDSGLYFDIIEEGEGDLIQFKDVVKFEYTGELLDGTSIGENQILETSVDKMIGSWKEILLQVKKGAKIYIITPPQLAYGTHVLEDIPENSVIVYTLEVLDVN